MKPTTARLYRLRIRIERLIREKSAPFPEASYWQLLYNKTMKNETLLISRAQYNRFIDGNRPGKYNSYICSDLGWGKNEKYPVKTIELTTPDGQFVGAFEGVEVERHKFLPFSKVPITSKVKADKQWYERNKLPLE